MRRHTSSFRLGLDARTVHRAARRGTGKNLIDLYTQVLDMRPDWQVIGYHRGPVDAPMQHDGYVGRLLECPGDRFHAWRHWRLPAAATADKVDLVHCPANLVPRWMPVPTLVTIHDLLPLNGLGKTAGRMERSIRRCIARGTVIVTPSRYTADLLVHRFQADPERIVVNHWAADRGMKFTDDANRLETVADRYGLATRPILHLGAPDPRKNTFNAITAYAKLPATLRNQTPLLVIGLDQQEHRRQMADLCEHLGVSDCVKLHGFAAEGDMPALFSMARALLYPSHSEGFGLPILDAWTTQTPVVTSNTTSLPEVGGQAVLYADPRDPDQISEMLRTALEDQALRSTLIAAGRQRVKQFTWTRTAERFVHAVELALGQTKGAYRDAA